MKYKNFYEWWKTVDDDRKLPSEKDIALDAWDACVNNMPATSDSKPVIEKLIIRYRNKTLKLIEEISTNRDQGHFDSMHITEGKLEQLEIVIKDLEGKTNEEKIRD